MAEADVAKELLKISVDKIVNLRTVVINIFRSFGVKVNNDDEVLNVICHHIVDCKRKTPKTVK